MPVIFPDVELWACGVIRSALASRSETYAQGVKVDNKIPNPIPARLVAVRHDGGPVRDYVLEDPRLGITVFAGYEDEVSGLARLVSAILRAAASGSVTSVRQQMGPSPIADPSGKPCRYMTFQLTAKGADLVNPTP